ncbi:biotin--[acetyl-CoA-carboxylase] ligase [Mycoplasmatota bacterium]|nr:biotin--[acetyl-CoA-carboxylase] ligase [Mycoplasmatota bacterium]
MKVIQLKEVGSTNLYFKHHLNEHHHFDVVYTYKQTQGKGRHINQWYSDHESIAFSILIKDQLKETDFSLLPLFMSMVVHKALYNYSKKVMIKWPNDILIKDKKIVGILTESVIQKDPLAYIIGTGINVNNQKFPKEIEQVASSLAKECHQTFDKVQILNDILTIFHDQYPSLLKDPEKIIDYCNRFNSLKDQIITYQSQQGEKSGKCIGINKSGHLLVERKQERTELVSGLVQKIRNE